MTDWESRLESIVRFEFLPPAFRIAFLAALGLLGLLLLGSILFIAVLATHGV